MQKSKEKQETMMYMIASGKIMQDNIKYSHSEML